MSDAEDLFLKDVVGVEPYESAFRRTVEKVRSESCTLRWEGRREWMAFMREHVMDYITRWPESRDDLIGFLQDTVQRGKGGRAYQADAQAVLEIAVMLSDDSRDEN
jgi:hypothetical protein